MKRHETFIVYMTNRVGSCIDEKLNDLECDIFIPTCVVERSVSTIIIIIGSTGSIREIFEKTSNDSLVESFIAACRKEENKIVDVQIIFLSLNYFTKAVL
jgi:hypothetical protein